METGRLTAVAGSTGSSKRPVKIRIKHLVKRFRTLLAVDDVSLDIEEGTFFAIVGPSGCGKTTMLRILGGLETQTSGEVEMGKPARGRPQYSMIFQGDSIFPWMTVWDNAAYGLRMRKAPRAEIEASVSHWLDRTGLPPTITAAAVIAMRLGHIFKPREPKRLRMTNPDSIDKLPMYNEG